MKRKLLLLCFMLLAVIITISGCGNSEVVETAGNNSTETTVTEPVTPDTSAPEIVYADSINMPFSETIIPTGQTVDLTIYTYCSPLDSTLTYTSSDESIASVSEDGIVKGVGAGNATITISSGEVSSTIKVTVAKSGRSEENAVYVNQYASTETYQKNATPMGELKIHYIAVDDKANGYKSDAFLMEYNGEFWINDVGSNTTSQLNYFLSIRKLLLESAGLSDKLDDINYKIKLNIIVSHFHSDHVGGMSRFLNSNFISIDTIYCGTLSVADVNMRYSSLYSKMVSALSTRSIYKIMLIDFGRTYTISSATGDFTIQLFASAVDWGSDEYVNKLMDLYGGNTIDDCLSDNLLNSNSIWCRAVLGDASFLFTGDTIKKRDKVESFDVMLEYYGESLRSDVVKYVHHGAIRDLAFMKTKEMLLENSETGTLIFTIKDATAEKIADRLNVSWYNTGYGTVIASTTGSEITWKFISK